MKRISGKLKGLFRFLHTCDGGVTIVLLNLVFFADTNQYSMW